MDVRLVLKRLLLSLFLVAFIQPTAIAVGDIPRAVVEFSENNVWRIQHEAGSEAHGSAVWIDENTALSVCHVAKHYKVVLATNWDNSKGVALDVVFCDKETDIAVLKRHPADTGGPVTKKIAVGPPPKKGTSLLAIGYPFNFPQVITFGHYQQKVTEDGKIRHHITVPIQPGNSGGPVITYENGKITVVGLITSVFTKRLFRGSISIGHATQMTDLNEYIEDA